MRVARRLLWVATAFLLLHASAASACYLVGKVVCQGTGTAVSGVTVQVNGPNGFTASGMTDAEGLYSVYMPYKENGVFFASIDLAAVGGGVVVSPSQPAALSWPADSDTTTIDWVVDVAGCVQKGCWLTGGGAKFSPIAGIAVAEKGPKVSFGGNVNPSCSPDPGEGGQWSHVDHDLKLFFQGRAITVDECGTLFPPEGSTSPRTPYTYILYHGTGVLKGIGGNKYEKLDACFSARAEDRNEPGSSGQRDGAYKDRYFLRVFDCATDATLLVLESTPGEPIIITDGNLQLHVSSCP